MGHVLVPGEAAVGAIVFYCLHRVERRASQRTEMGGAPPHASCDKNQRQSSRVRSGDDVSDSG